MSAGFNPSTTVPVSNPDSSSGGMAVLMWHSFAFFTDAI
jgi:hypothetical protein